MEHEMPRVSIDGVIWHYWGLGDSAPMMENHMERKMEHETEAGFICGFTGICMGLNHFQVPIYLFITIYSFG